MMPKFRYVRDEDVRHYLQVIVNEAAMADFKPAAIVAPSRGGLGLGTMMSHYYDVPLFPIELSTRDHTDANPRSNVMIKNSLSRASLKGPILFIDDINDTGRTLRELMDIIVSMEADDINLGDIRYAVLLEKYSSEHEFDFVGSYIDLEDSDTWVVFPWEDWWHRAQNA
jgi:hypoxanthine phosphoribosyltransferase